MNHLSGGIAKEVPSEKHEKSSNASADWGKIGVATNFSPRSRGRGPCERDMDRDMDREFRPGTLLRALASVMPPLRAGR